MLTPARHRSSFRTLMAKILIVDDEPFNLDVLEQELVDRGYAIERAPDGAAALVAFESFRPDLILLDYQMPDMNGIAVMKELKSRGNDAPVDRKSTLLNSSH